MEKIISKFKSDSGASLAETALCLPVLFIMLMGMVDLGRWINQFHIISSVTYEAARYGASLAGVEEGAGHTSVWDENSDPQAFQGSATVAAQIKVRVSSLLQMQNVDPAYAKLKLSFDRNPTNNNISIEVTLPFQPIFPLLRTMVHSVHASANAPYLFARTTDVPYRRGS